MVIAYDQKNIEFRILTLYVGMFCQKKVPNDTNPRPPRSKKINF